MNWADIKDKVVYPIIVGVFLAMTAGFFTIYNDVQANTASRISLVSKQATFESMDKNITALTVEVKYLRSDINDLKQSNKDIVKTLNKVEQQKRK